MTTLICRSCGEADDLAGGAWRCPCGGLFDLAFSPGAPAIRPPGSTTHDAPWSLWRYREVLPFRSDSVIWPSVTLGEGMTPLVALGPGVQVKLDFLMPTLSFKDRGSAVLVAKAAELGVRRLVADSSGNAGTSIAAYAARAGIAADVFVPSHAADQKVRQLRGFGASVHRVSGSRSDVAAAAIDHVDHTASFYASHVYNPLFHHGTKTYVYELYEQLDGRLPDTLVIPAGNGTLLLGASIGIQELLATGRVQRSPRLVVVQAAACAPLAHAWRMRTAQSVAIPDPGTDPRNANPTVAEGIAISAPPRLDQMLDAVCDSGGAVVTVSDEAILTARRDLARLGIDVEPTAAATFAGWRDVAALHPRPPSTSVVVALTGAGLKSPSDKAGHP